MQRFRMYVLTGLALFMPCILISCAATPVSITEDVPRMDKEPECIQDQGSKTT